MLTDKCWDLDNSTKWSQLPCRAGTGAGGVTEIWWGATETGHQGNASRQTKGRRYGWVGKHQTATTESTTEKYKGRENYLFYQNPLGK